MLKKTFIVVLIMLLLGVSGCGTFYGNFVARKNRLQLSKDIAIKNAIYGAEFGVVASFIWGGTNFWLPFVGVFSMFYIVDEITGGMYIKKP